MAPLLSDALANAQTVGADLVSGTSAFLDWSHHLEPVATILSALFTAVAAVAAARSAGRARDVAEEAKAARIQSAEPFVRVEIGSPYFTFSFRPEARLAPAMRDSFLIPVPSEPSIVVANYGGGPALDVCVSIASATDDPAPHGGIIKDTGGFQGQPFVAGSEQTTATREDGTSDILRYLNRQEAFIPACGKGEPQPVFLRGELLARILPLTIEAEQRGYLSSGVPPELGRIAWSVHLTFKTGVGEPREERFRIYAERIRVGLLNPGPNGSWVEKAYICQLFVEPPEGFPKSPVRVDATVKSPGPGQLHFGLGSS